MTIFRLGFRKRALTALLVMTAFSAAACAPSGDDGATGEQVEALGSFGSWTSIPGRTLFEPPALAKAGTSTLNAFAASNTLRSGLQIFNTAENVTGGWSGTWTQISSSFNSPPIASRPAAVGFQVFSGPLINRFAIVVKRTDNQYYIRIQDQGAVNVLLNWTAMPLSLPSGVSFESAPAVTFVPSSSVTEPKNSLVVAGLGTDGRIWAFRNTLQSGNAYSNSAWTSLGPVPIAGFDSAPALTFAAPSFVGQPSIVMASGVVNAQDFIDFRFTLFNGSGWLPWTNVTTGIFSSGPALATGSAPADGGLPSSEVTFYGLGTDARVWVARLVNGVVGGFSPIGTQTFHGNPAAFGIGAFARVTALDASNVGVMNLASSP
jgi:hypothetical protein